ncbi:hypothetical protein HZS_6534 [Henneguya salminicola]|nr:hypothetical protein HZS_6534 [Henneguya salminicola]
MPCIITADFKKTLKSLHVSIILSKMELVAQISHCQRNDAIPYIRIFLVERGLEEFWSCFRKT